MVDEEERARLREALKAEQAKAALESYHHERRAGQLGATFVLTLALLAQAALAAPWRGLTVAGLAALAALWLLRRWRCHACGRLPLSAATALHHWRRLMNPPGCPRCGQRFER